MNTVQNNAPWNVIDCTFNFNPLNRNEVGSINSIFRTQRQKILKPKMDFEKEMQKSLRVIRQNLQALSSRDRTPNDLNDSRMRVKRRRNTMTLPAQETSTKFVEQQSTRKERCLSI